MTKKEIIFSYLNNKKFIRSSLLFWVVLYLLVLMLQYTGGREGDVESLKKISLFAPLVLLVFYLNFFLCELYFLKNKTRYLFYNLLLLIIFLLLAYLYTKDEIVLLQKQFHFSRIKAAANRLMTVPIYYFLLLLISTLYWSVLYAAKKGKENLEIELRLRNMENEKIIAEKQFLQSQINPHFLYNTLNFFYAKSLTHSAELAESVLLLSNIMRYSLEQKENSSGMVLLEQEVEHINNMIKINQFRFSNKLQIQFLISGEIKKIRVVPLILITLVENAFKHGELHDASHPVVLRLTINETKQTIHFTVENKKKAGPKEMGTGIGLENTRRRLAFAYNNNDCLDLKEEEHYYTAIVQLPIYKDV